MAPQGETGGITRNKRFVFRISKQMYDKLRELQQKEGFSGLSPLICALIEKRKLAITEDAYSLDRVMGVLSAVYDVLAVMELDLRLMAFLPEVPPEDPPEMICEDDVLEENFPDYSGELINLNQTVDQVCQQIIPVTALITQLSKAWLQG